MVEIKESEEEGVAGSPTGAVWVVNNSEYHRRHAEKRAKTQLDGVLMARIADSLKDLVDCGRISRWPKFEKAEADYLDYYPCFQKRGGALSYGSTFPMINSTEGETDAVLPTFNVKESALS
ncbi:hypothetical protein PG994_008400 [Apiospora phragmitis]|uniref:Uncharacterized protein n=1 Tax=Apiospora phragmitis TaxID=2905665 RepID=A0ABR1USW6_9PEZI